MNKFLSCKIAIVPDKAMAVINEKTSLSMCTHDFLPVGKALLPPTETFFSGSFVRSFSAWIPARDRVEASTASQGQKGLRKEAGAVLRARLSCAPLLLCSPMRDKALC